MAIFGLFCIVGINGHELGTEYKTGFYLDLSTALCYTRFLLTIRKLQATAQEFSFFYNLMLVSLATTIILGAQVTFSGGSFAIPDPWSLLSLLCLGLFSQTIGWVLIANAMPKIRASLTGLILLLPTLALFCDVLIFHCQTSLLNWLGVFITLTAIYMDMRGRQK